MTIEQIGKKPGQTNPLPLEEGDRACGILLHPTSLPSRHGIGDLGEAAYRWVDFLELSGQKFWQVLPLNPVGYGESPYQSFSAFAGNELLISLDRLAEEGLLTGADLAGPTDFSPDWVVYSRVQEYKEPLLKKAFTVSRAKNKSEEYYAFLRENSSWLENYALFMALKDYFNGVAWNYWDEKIASRDEEVLAGYREKLHEEMEYHYFLQYQFFSQWLALKKYANSKGIYVIGDLPIFVAADSSDTWANPRLFQLDQQGNPVNVAGVPPDYFSATGQLWGNPHYDWLEMAADDYRWWRERFSCLLANVDIIRIDHFRGFEAYWEIPGGAETAEHGRWVKGPGKKFFAKIREFLGQVPLIAEDLGIITPPVVELKDEFGFPGMKVLHFMMETGVKEVFLSLFEKNTVLYTGTHDNDTTVGWYKNCLVKNPAVISLAQKYFQIDRALAEQEVCRRLVKIVLESQARIAIIPLQDILGLDSEARMNFPGTIGGNWSWRFRQEWLTGELAGNLKGMVVAAHR